MAISETIKINILINKKYKDKVLDWLQTQSLMQIDEQGATTAVVNPDSLGPKQNEVTESKIDYDLAGVKFALDFLTPYDETKVPLAKKLAGNKIELTNKQMTRRRHEFDYKKIVESCERIENKLNEEKNEIEKLEQEKKVLEPWRNLNIASREAKTQKTKTIFGKIATQKYLDFINKLEKESKNFALEKVHLTDRESYIALTLSEREEIKFSKVMNEMGFDAIELPYSDVVPSEALAKIKTQKHKNTKTLSDLTAEAKKLTSEIKNLKIIFDWLTWKKEKREAETKLGQTKYTHLLTGWIEKINFKGLHNKLQKLTKNNVSIKPAKLTKKDILQQPVVIRNKPLCQPFESVTGIYGLPKSNEVDPTVFLAPFFIIFFGFCLTDAGYGILLSLLAWLAIKIMKIPAKNQKLFKVLMYGGVSTFILGALFGGWFGITLDNLPNPAIKNFLISLRVIDPMKNPLLVLGITFALGIIQVWTGIIISMWWQMKQKQYREALLSKGVWVYFIPTILFWVSGKAGILPQELLRLSNVLLLIGIGTIILTQGRKQKNIIAKLGAGILSLYGLVGYLSDVLSYSRLLALGLSTGIIAMVVNLIAGLFKDMIPYIGWIPAILILVGGHAFNIVINVLGAFIHSGRLQFVEFLPKFMEGGGMRFRPLKRESKYVEIVNSE